MSEFDYWGRGPLDILIAALRARGTPPSRDDQTFWQELADACHEADDEGEVTMTGKELAQDVRARRRLRP